MEWKKIENVIREIVSHIKKECIIQNTAIRDDIFSILEDKCTVMYYPLQNEKNRGFHIKRIVKNQLEDFVYINTAKPIVEQIFTAAHELGHIFEVSKKVWNMMKYPGAPSEQEEEDITNLFAAEFLMPADAFIKVFRVYMKEAGVKNGKVKVEDFILVMVMQMNVFMVPYEAVRRRLVETEILSEKEADVLKEKEYLVNWLAKYQNSYLEKGTEIKTISGIREVIEEAETREDIDAFLVKRVKKNLEIIDLPETEELEIKIGDTGDE